MNFFEAIECLIKHTKETAKDNKTLLDACDVIENFVSNISHVILKGKGENKDEINRDTN